MAYRWRNFAFEAPEGRDESSLLLIDRAGPPAWNLNLRADELPGGSAAFAAYCEAQKPPQGVVVDKKEQRTVAGRPAALIDQRMKLEDGSVLRQQQAFVLDGKSVVIVTMTAKPAAQAKAQQAFDRLLATLKFED